MDLRQTVVDSGKKLVERTPLMRIVSDDRVMRVADAVFDARGRLRAAAGKAAEAWERLVRGYRLPEIDPANVEDVPVARPKSKGNGASGVSGSTESSGAEAPAAPRAAPPPA